MAVTAKFFGPGVSAMLSTPSPVSAASATVPVSTVTFDALPPTPVLTGAEYIAEVPAATVTFSARPPQVITSTYHGAPPATYAGTATSSYGGTATASYGGTADWTYALDDEPLATYRN